LCQHYLMRSLPHSRKDGKSSKKTSKNNATEVKVETQDIKADIETVVEIEAIREIDTTRTDHPVEMTHETDLKTDPEGPRAHLKEATLEARVEATEHVLCVEPEDTCMQTAKSTNSAKI